MMERSTDKVASESPAGQLLSVSFFQVLLGSGTSPCYRCLVFLLFSHQSHLLIVVGQVLLSFGNYLCVQWQCSHKLIVASWVFSLREGLITDMNPNERFHVTV